MGIHCKGLLFIYVTDFKKNQKKSQRKNEIEDLAPLSSTFPFQQQTGFQIKKSVLVYRIPPRPVLAASRTVHRIGQGNERERKRET